MVFFSFYTSEEVEVGTVGKIMLLILSELKDRFTRQQLSLEQVQFVQLCMLGEVLQLWTPALAMAMLNCIHTMPLCFKGRILHP